MLAIAAQLEQELSDVGLRTDENEEDRICTQNGHDRQAVPMLEHGSGQRTPIRRSAELVCRSDYRGNARGEIFCVEPGYTLTIDQQTIPSQDDRRFDPFTLSDRCDEVPNARHSRSSRSEAEAYG